VRDHQIATVEFVVTDQTVDEGVGVPAEVVGFRGELVERLLQRLLKSHTICH
jgi:hypothetical protein